MKICSKCKKEKLKSEFNKSLSIKDGLSYHCKECIHSYMNNYIRKRDAADPLLRKKRNAVSIKCANKRYNSDHEFRQKCLAYRRKALANPIYRKKVATQTRRQNLKAIYNLSLEEYDQILVSQNNVCAICKEADNNIALGVDHNHANGKVRGLLCKQCNLMIGNAKEKIEIMGAAIKYLKRVN
jgi:hypothetical protein